MQVTFLPSILYDNRKELSMKQSFDEFVMAIVKKTKDVKLDLSVMEQNIARLTKRENQLA